MKKMFVVLFACAFGITSFSSFANAAKVGEASKKVAKQNAEQRIRAIDYQGKSFGAEMPKWVEMATANDVEQLRKKDPRFEGKIPIVLQDKGANLTFLKKRINNYDAQQQISQRILSAFQSMSMDSSDESQGIEHMFQEWGASGTKGKFSGLTKEMDFWVKDRVIDPVKKDTYDEYSYIVIYSISETDLKNAIMITLGQLDAKTQEEKRLVKKMEETAKNVEFLLEIGKTEE